MTEGSAATVHPTPWTAFYDPDECQYLLLDCNGATAGRVGDKSVAQTITRLVNEAARRRSGNAPLASVIPLSPSRTVEPPPAPNPVKGAATTWGEVFDNLIYLLDEQQIRPLRKQLFEYARVTDTLPLPDVFVNDPDRGSSA